MLRLSPGYEMFPIPTIIVIQMVYIKMIHLPIHALQKIKSQVNKNASE